MEQGHILSPGQGPCLIGEPDIRRVFLRRRGHATRVINVRGDHEGNIGFDPPPKLRDAAVLVPLVSRDDSLSVLLTQRTAHLAAHAGQISFPGGGVEEGDAAAEDTALRETEEEVGLDRRHVDVIGRLDTYVTGTGFRITPVVALIRAPFTLSPDPYEVAEVFEVPLNFILDPTRRERRTVEYKGKPRHFWAFPYGERFIWGATAGMLVNLCDVLDAVGGGDD